MVGRVVVDRALGLAAPSGRFATGDLSSIVDHLSQQVPYQQQLHIADENSSLQRRTRSWEGVGAMTKAAPVMPEERSPSREGSGSRTWAPTPPRSSPPLSP